jgi:ribosome assembly protein RRB1
MFINKNVTPYIRLFLNYNMEKNTRKPKRKAKQDAVQPSGKRKQIEETPMDDAELEFEGEEEQFEDEDSSHSEEEVKTMEEEKAEPKQKMEFDNSAYEMLHRAEVEWSCLSIDFLLEDRLNTIQPWLDPYASLPKEGSVETEIANEKQIIHKLDSYPLSLWMVGGSQTGTKQNKIYVMKWNELHKTFSDESDSDSEPEAQPKLEWLAHNIKGSVNKIRSMHGSPIVSTWTDNGEVYIFNLSPLTSLINAGSKGPIPNCVLKSFQFKKEGYAMDWSHCKQGLLALGSCDHSIIIVEPHNSTFSDWSVSGTISGAHDASVEDVQFSPTESFVLASCSVDKKLKVWDLRNPTKPAITIEAHDSDVNVISWNHSANFMIASGAEKGDFKIWDIRYPDNEPLSYIKWHKDQINSIQFAPRDQSVVAVSSADDKCSIWDFGVEAEGKVDKDVPQQLMFVHEGQSEIKELRYHPYYHDLLATTSSDGVHVFRPNFSPVSESDDKEEQVMEDIVLKEREDIE